MMIDEKFPQDDLKINAMDFLVQISSDIERSNPSVTPSIIIGGAQRCGKTTVARLISKDLKMFRLKSDYVSRSLYGKLNVKQKRWSASYVFKKLLTLFPQGIIAEGTIFTDIAKNISIWGNKRNIAVYIIGSTSSYEKKHATMLSFRNNNSCWTSEKFSDSELLNLAKSITEKSVVNRELCLKHGFTYFDVDPCNFDRDIKRIATKIKNTSKLDGSGRS